MRVGIVYSAHAEDEIDQAIFQAAYGNERYYNCMQNLASIIKALSSNPYNIPSRYGVHKLWRDFKGYLGAYLEPELHEEGKNALRIVFRVMSADNGFDGIDDPRFPYLRDRVGASLSNFDYIVHVWVGCYDYHGNKKSKTRSAIKDTFVG